MPCSQVIGPGDHPGPNLGLCPAGTQHGHRSAEIDAAGVLSQATQAHPGTNARSRTPEPLLGIVTAIKVDRDVDSVPIALRLTGRIGLDLLLLTLLASTLDQCWRRCKSDTKRWRGGGFGGQRARAASSGTSRRRRCWLVTTTAPLAPMTQRTPPHPGAEPAGAADAATLQGKCS